MIKINCEPHVYVSLEENPAISYLNNTQSATCYKCGEISRLLAAVNIRFECSHGKGQAYMCMRCVTHVKHK